MDEFGLDPREIGIEGYQFVGQPVRIRVVHIPTGLFGEAEGEEWEKRSLERRARAELAEKLGRGGGAAGVPSRRPPIPPSPKQLAEDASVPEPD